MKIYYKSTKLEKILTKEKKIIKNYGADVSDKIIQRINELNAAPCLLDLPPTARPHPYQPKSSEIFSIDISKHKKPRRLLFKPYGNYDIENYETITEIEIQTIKKIHS